MVKRYGFDQAYTHPPLLFYAKPDGCYVTQTDYATLQAERDRLKQSNADSQHDMDRLIAERDALRGALEEIMTYAEIDSSELHHEDQLADIFNHARTALKDTDQ